MICVRRALLSASDKTGLIEFARGLAGLSVELISTGGTARTLRSAGIDVTDVAEITGFPEMLDGRVKTLHPRIHGGLLAVRGRADHDRQLADQAIVPIDLIAVTLYPFAATLADPGCRLDAAIEQIDIGGPALLRSAAKNWSGVAVVTEPADYPAVLAELRQTGALSAPTRLDLARKAFALTARYDAAIAGFFDRLAAAPEGLAPETFVSTLGPPAGFPATLHLRLEKIQDLRYGENPHQRAAFYRDLDASGGLAAARQLQGKELSYNNLLDLQAVWDLVGEFAEPVAAIVKHNTPCGVATGDTPVDAYLRARDADPVSAFGGIIGLNRPLDAETARAIASTFAEAVIAPRIDPEALALLAERKNLRVIEPPADTHRLHPGCELRRVSGGLLVQERDRAADDAGAFRTVTRRSPTESEITGLRFAWRVVKHVKSNAIVVADDRATLGIGAGQMSRVDAVTLAVGKAGAAARGAVLASDAFFPFRDGVDAAAAAGITAIVQPGGSVRDAEVIAAADARGLAMVFTGVRHFRH